VPWSFPKRKKPRRESELLKAGKKKRSEGKRNCGSRNWEKLVEGLEEAFCKLQVGRVGKWGKISAGKQRT